MNFLEKDHCVKMINLMKHLRRFNESLSATSLTKDDVIKILQQKCKKFLGWSNEFFEECLIWRKDEDRGDYVLVDPKSSTSLRIDPYSSNDVHNTLTSNLESWRDWPKRNKCLCCASVRRATSHAAGFVKGRSVDYVVIPFDTTKVATGDRGDFWECFRKLPTRVAFRGDNSRRASLPFYVSALLIDLGIIGEYQHIETRIDRFDEMGRKLTPNWTKTLVNPDWNKLKTYLHTCEVNDAIKTKYFGRFWDNSLSLLGNLDKILDPVFNKFKLGDITSTMKLYQELDPDDEDEKNAFESWFEDEAIMIKSDKLNEILQELGLE